MRQSIKTLGLVFCAGIVSTGSATIAQVKDDVFVGGSDYVYNLNSNETIEQQIVRSPNTLVVPKESVASMGQVYRDCAKDAGFSRGVQARAQVYSSHFMAVTLIQNPKMTAIQFNNAVACSKRAIAPRAVAIPRSIVSSGTVAKRTPVYSAPGSRFSVQQDSLVAAQNAYARCVNASGFKGRPQLQAQKFDGALSTVALVRSGNMTTTQYDKSVSCMAKKVDEL